MTPFARNVARLFYLFLLIGGLSFYMIWGFMYSGWMDIGVYSLTIVMVLFGILGTLLYSKDREEFHVAEEEL